MEPMISQISLSQSPKEIKRREEIGRLAGEMEALFIHQLLKVMREQVEKEREEKGFGQGIHQGLFDLELARELALKKGIGLKEIIERQLLQANLNAKPSEDRDDLSNGRPSQMSQGGKLR
jgi:flagellar protein FlgJ